MDIQIGRGKSARRAYGIDEIALVPGTRTLDPSLADTGWRIGSIEREIPIVASAMDGVVDVRMAVLLSRLGALGVLNLEGIQTRYANPEPILERITSSGTEDFVQLMQELYAEPVKPELIEQRILEIKQQGGIAAVSATPAGAVKYGAVVSAAAADLFFVQATVVSTAHLSPSSVVPLNLAEFCREMPMPVVSKSGEVVRSAQWAVQWVKYQSEFLPEHVQALFACEVKSRIAMALQNRTDPRSAVREYFKELLAKYGQDNPQAKSKVIATLEANGLA